MKSKKRPRRIDYDSPHNLVPVHVAVKEYPFHARVLGRMSGLSPAQVYYRLRQHGVCLRDLRNGLCGKGADIVKKFEIKNLNVDIISVMMKTHLETATGNVGHKQGSRRKGTRRNRKR